MCTFTTVLDFGVLGEQDVEVHYTHYRAYSGDRETPDEPEYCEVNRVIWNKIDVVHELSEENMSKLSGEALDDWNGE